jgi:phage-related baseplate assembly protein
MSSGASEFASISLDALPRPDIVESLDVETIIAARKARLTELVPAVAPVLALESEPLTKLIEASAYRELMLRQRYNEEALALTLAFALGADLDHIGLTYYQEPRLELAPAAGAVPAVMETDAAYRRRLQLKPASWSTAGPRDAYLFHALSAHSGVRDAGVFSPYPGTTFVAILGTGPDGIPEPEVLDAVRARLNDEEVRPLCETVVVQQVQIQVYVAHVVLYTYPGADAAAKVEEARAALQILVDSLFTVGSDIARSAIAAAAHVPGVQRVDVTRPVADLVCDPTQIARCTWVDVQWGGTAQ